MRKKNSLKDMPRRKFLRNFGSGVIGTSVLIKNLHADENNKPGDNISKDHIENNKVTISLTINGKKRNVAVFRPARSLKQNRYKINLARNSTKKALLSLR